MEKEVKNKKLEISRKDVREREGEKEEEEEQKEEEKIEERVKSVNKTVTENSRENKILLLILQEFNNVRETYFNTYSTSCIRARGSQDSKEMFTASLTAPALGSRTNRYVLLILLLLFCV